MALVVYNTLTRRKEPFTPLEDNVVRIYVCGPTVYDEPHVGHARAAVAFDVIRRTLESLGFKVRYVQNVTDVDDKIIARAAEEGRDPVEVAQRYTRAYDAAMEALGVRPPDVTPHATAHIVDMIKLIQELVDKGAAYAVDGDVYFSIERFPEYGKLSKRTLEQMRAGERIEPDPRKRHPMDFALWKGAKPGEPAWPSPWGAGRPGWHIECSAMSMKYLGETFDAHGGGLDLIFPHHENEIAQSESATGKPFARMWLHNGFVTIGGEKMAKSLKNFVLVRELLAQHPAPVIRTLLVSAHYRSPLDFTSDALRDARSAWGRLATFARNARAVLGGATEAWTPAQPWRDKFFAAMEDDFNTPEALAALFDLVSAGNPLIEGAESGAREVVSELTSMLHTFLECASVLGLDPVGQWPQSRSAGSLAPLVEYLLELREDARKTKDFARADEIRARLGAAGVVVEDRPGGPRWHVAE
jgi:cysteinyl-tRNA synthetase